MKKKTKIIIAAAICIVVVTGVVFSVFLMNWGKLAAYKPVSVYQESNNPATVFQKSNDIQSLGNLFSQEFLLRNPDYRILTGNTWIENAKRNGDVFLNPSEDFSKKTYEIYKNYLKNISELDYSNMKENDKLTAEIMKWYLEDYTQGEKYSGLNFPINPINGIQYVVNEYMTRGGNVTNLDEAKKYISYLNSYEGLFDECLKQMEAMEKQNLILSKDIIEDTLQQISFFTISLPKENKLYNDFMTKILKVKEISTKKKQQLLKDAENIIEKSVYPAYKKISNFLEKQKLGAPTGQNIKNPNWAQYYKYSLKHYTTMDLDPTKIHEMAIKRVNELKKEFIDIYLERTAKRLNMSVEELKTSGIPLQSDFSSSYRTAQLGKLKGEELLNQYNSTIESSKELMAPLFNNIPDEKVKVEFNYIDAIKSFWYKYVPSPMDESKPAVVYVSTPDEAISSTMFFSQVYHNVYPGNHMQLIIQRSQKDVPFFRRVYSFNGFNDAWGYYCENLAYENGFYPDSSHKLAYIIFQLQQAALAAADTGINYMGWSRSQTMSYMIENAGDGKSYDVDKCFIIPGSGCAGYLGGLKILELRNKAKSELGTKFNIKEFHDAILNNGSMPLTMLEKQVQKYIASKK